MSAEVDVIPAFLDEPAPCDACPLRARCASERLACAAFSLFVSFRDWSAAPRQPTRERFDEVFAPEKPLRAVTIAPERKRKGFELIVALRQRRAAVRGRLHCRTGHKQNGGAPHATT
jgi:hypothetical protein